MGINVTGKIVIVRYGKIFRGNKVGTVLTVTAPANLVKVKGIYIPVVKCDLDQAVTLKCR